MPIGKNFESFVVGRFRKKDPGFQEFLRILKFHPAELAKNLVPELNELAIIFIAETGRIVIVTDYAKSAEQIVKALQQKFATELAKITK